MFGLVASSDLPRPDSQEPGLHPLHPRAHRWSSAPLSTPDLLGHGIARREHDDRRPAPGTQPPADLHAVHPRQQHSEHDQIARLGFHRRQGHRALHAVAHTCEPVPLDRHDVVVVLHDQDSFAHRS
jgi:hypothetical protein